MIFHSEKSQRAACCVEGEHKPHFDVDGRFIHPCCICGKQAQFGYGVSLRNNKLGTWYCDGCKPSALSTNTMSAHPNDIKGRDAA